MNNRGDQPQAVLRATAGARLADVGLPLGQWPTLLLLSAVWAAVMLVVHGFAGMYRLRARQIG